MAAAPFDESRFPELLLLRKIPFFSFVLGGATGFPDFPDFAPAETSVSEVAASTLLPTMEVT